MTDNVYYYEPSDPAIQRVIESECPTCEGTGIAPNVIYTPDLVEGVDFEWCETCGGIGEVEEVVEYDPYENADDLVDDFALLGAAIAKERGLSPASPVEAAAIGAQALWDTLG
jgi:hypothetical protein